MLLAFQAYRDFEQFMHGEARNATSNYIVISKPVSAINTLGNLLGAKAPSFSTSEIVALKEHHSVADVGAFTAASFNVSGHFALASIRVGTEMFLESVPDRFIDVDFEASYEPTSPVGAKSIGEVVINENANIRKLASCDLFTADLVELKENFTIENKDSFVSILVLEGDAVLSWDDGNFEIKKGDSVFVPADFKVDVTGKAQILLSYL